MNTVVLRNAEIINEGRRFRADILIRAGRFERIEPRQIIARIGSAQFICYLTGEGLTAPA